MISTISKFHILIFSTFMALLLTVNSNVYTFSSGAPLGYAGAPLEFTCADGPGCHNGPIVEEGFTITVTDASGTIVDSYIPNETYSIHIQTTVPTDGCNGFQSLILGDESGVSVGTVSPGAMDQSSGTSGNRTYVAHNTPNTLGDWTYTWVAPNISPSEDITIYTSVNVSNCNNASTGDLIITGLKKLNGEPVDCDLDWNLMLSQPGILYFDCNYGLPDTPRLEVAITNFSGGSGNYVISAPGGEFSETTASVGDTVYFWFTQEELNNNELSVLVNDEDSDCLQYDSLNIALAGFPIEAICNSEEDPCSITDLDNNLDGVVTLEDFECGDNSMIISGSISGNNIGYYLKINSVDSFWVNSPGNFQFAITDQMLNDDSNLEIDISLGQSGAQCSTIDLEALFNGGSIANHCGSCNFSFVNELEMTGQIECYDDGSEYSMVFSLDDFSGNATTYILSLSQGSLSSNTIMPASGSTEVIVTLTQADLDAGEVILTVSDVNSTCSELNLLESIIADYPEHFRARYSGSSRLS